MAAAKFFVELDMGGHKVVNAADPTNPQDLVTLNYLGSGMLRWGTNTDTSAQGLTLAAQDAVTISALFPFGQITLDATDFLQFTSGRGMRVNTLDLVEMYTGSFYVDASSMAHSNSFIAVEAGIRVSSHVGDIEVTLPAGATFVLRDHNGDPILSMTEGSPDLHIPTGGVVVADL